MVSRVIFAVVLAAFGILYIVLAAAAVWPGLADGNWVSYFGALLFLASAVLGGLAAVRLVRAKQI